MATGKGDFLFKNNFDTEMAFICYVRERGKCNQKWILFSKKFNLQKTLNKTEQYPFS